MGEQGPELALLCAVAITVLAVVAVVRMAIALLILAGLSLQVKVYAFAN